jgi:Plasmid encoded RepA protein
MFEQDSLDRRVRMCAEIGLSVELTISQLFRAGYSADAIRARFPAAAPELFAGSSASQKPRLNAVAARPAGDIALRVLEQAPAVRPESVPAVPSPLSPGSEGVSFQYVPLIQCSFPHADPGNASTFTRRNGWLELTLSTARPDTGLPYGVPARLLTIYCASEAVRQRSPEIYLGKSVHEFLRLLDIPITRGERGSLRIYANQLLRLIHCAMTIDENIRDASGRSGLHIRQASFVQEARLWWDEVSGIGQGSSLVLTPVLYDSIVERSAPLSTRAIRQLRKSPMDLDVYAWLVHRLFTLNRPSSMSWAQLSGQFGHNYREIRFFRRFFGESMQRVTKVYPEAKVKCTDNGILLLPSRPHIEPRSRVR